MRIFSNSITIFLVAFSFVFCKISAQTNFDDYDSPTQDWIFGDAPEPKWVTALLKGSHSIPEDTEFILSIPILESAVTYEAIVDSNASFEITNDHLIITPKEDFHGYIFVNLKLVMSFILQVNPVNDIPEIALALIDFAVDEDSVLFAFSQAVLNRLIDRGLDVISFLCFLLKTKYEKIKRYKHIIACRIPTRKTVNILELE